jgi:hypothetical protein
MGGGEKDKANRMQDQQYAQQQQEHNQFMKQQQDQYDTAKQHAGELYSSLKGGYSGLANSPEHYNPGFSQTAYNTADEFAKTGGIDPTRKASIEGTIGQMKDFSKTGGLSDADMNRMQGNGYYDEYAKTGGVSDADRANIRARAGSPIVAAYKRANDVGNQFSSIQGGYGPGAAVMRDRALRGANADASNAALNAEGQIMDRVQQGREFGISGMSDSALKAQGLRTGNMATGMKSAGDLDMNLSNAEQQGREWGVGSLGTQDEARNQGQLASIGLDLSQKAAGLGGLSSLYGTAPGELSTNVGQTTQGQQSYDSAQNELIDSKLKNNPSFMDQMTSFVPSILGGAGGILGGIGSIRKPAYA